jgi:hypothetical protein
MSYPAPTTGIGVAAKINVAGNGSAPSGKQFVPGYNDVTLSLTGSGGFPETFQLNPEIVDVANTPVDPGTAYVLTAAASSSGNTAVYTGTIVATAGSLVGKTVVIAGFVTHTVNNGTFIITANNGTTTITVENAAAVAETHAATATLQETTNSLTYFIDGTKNYNPQYATSEIPSGTTTTAVATVSASGLITATAEGGTVVEVSFPTFNNTSGTTGAQSGNPMHGLPLNKIYAEVNVTVVA